ncbi:DUF1707 and DUF4190 domain-containing protein [Actinopolymorpha alba]|uniref:DUF1707 and DUF4190 domain-containing protein n=1 Tax=Actinopolymorpha alba TaxID=533267 RepID=UPI000381EF87|nr:DUF1707 and DUF4190 domain-containing protein [Actinopolymorpha alba]
MNANWHSMRASDADRQRGADVLKAALAEGRLTWAEHERRLDTLMRSQTYGELQAIIADLPSGPAPMPSPGPSAPMYPAPVGRAPQPWQGYPLTPARPTEPLAKASLILGALTPLTCGISGIAAVVTGHLALSKIKETGDDGRGLAIAGVTIGWVVVAMGVLWILAIIMA